MVCGDCARLAAGTALFTKLWRRLRLGRKNSMGLLTTLFVVRVAQIGQLQRWGVLAANLSDDPLCVSAALLIIALVMLPVPRIFLLGPAFLMMLLLNPAVFFGALVWLMQTLTLVSEMLCGFKEFLLCSLSFWKSILPWQLTESPQPGQYVDFFGAVVFVLWMASVIYSFVGMRLERFVAKQKLRSRLQSALRSPFHATFKEATFRRRRDSSSYGADAPRPMRRTFSGQFLQRALSEEQMETFREKHLSLLHARRSLLEEEENDFPEEMLPDCFEIWVSRRNVLEESYRILQEAPRFEFLAPTLRVRYTGEDGQDRGGVTQDWFSAVGHALTDGAGDDKSTSVFAMGKSSRMLIPRPVGQDAEGREGRFQDLLLAGRFLALAVLHGGRPLPLPLSPLVCKYMVGKPVDLDDVKCLDPDFYRQRVAPLLRPEGLSQVEAALGEQLTFVSAPTELRPAEELEPSGAERVVTEDNLDRYLTLLCEAFLCSELREELQCLLKGFWDVLPLATLQKAEVEAGDLSMLLMGSHSLDLIEWRRHTEEIENSAGGPVLSWFWEVLKEFDEEQRRLLLRFCTGSSRVPPGGFAELQPNFAVEVSDAGSPEHLPHAHTCINKLVLHRYSSKGQLREKLLQALPTEGFQFA